MTDFSQLGFSQDYCQFLCKRGYQKPSAIQSAAIPPILQGKDLLGIAKTGSGKTAAAMLPAAYTIDPTCSTLQVLVLTPTRELAVQYAVEATKFMGYHQRASYAIYGGVSMDLQKAKVRAGISLLVATPGRLIDHIYQRTIDITTCRLVVLDEVDEMFSMGFAEDVAFILDCLVQQPQLCMFSATITTDVRNKVIARMQNPVEVVHKGDKEDAIDIPATINERYCYVAKHSARSSLLIEWIKRDKPRHAIIFCTSRRSADQLIGVLKPLFPRCDCLHGGLDQGKRQSVIDRFGQQKTRLLVATDIAARGLDFSTVSDVYVYEFSRDYHTHAHRIGRTGRQGKEGRTLALITDRDKKLLNAYSANTQRPLHWVHL